MSELMTPEEAVDCLCGLLAAAPWREGSVQTELAQEAVQGKLGGGAVALEGLSEDVEKKGLPEGFDLWVASLKGKQGLLCLLALVCWVGGIEPSFTAGAQPTAFPRRDGSVETELMGEARQ